MSRVTPAADGLCSQETFLFRGSISENIAMGRPGATYGENIAAAKAAHAHDFIMSFDLGYASPCGERRIRFFRRTEAEDSDSRAILKNTPIILLDQATSALEIRNPSARCRKPCSVFALVKQPW